MLGNYSKRLFTRQPALVSQVAPELNETWANSWFLTFDVDWASDEVISDTLAILQQFDVPSTWLITHDSPILNDLRSIQNIELGLHPNFNDLLDGGMTDNPVTARTVVEELKFIVPEATCVRSHSMVQSSRILNIFSEFGLTHDLNTFIPSGSGMVCSPWRLWNGMTRVPSVWEDDVWCLYEATNQPEFSPSELVENREGIVVINFHPIHVYLNTESLERYEVSRHKHQNAKELREYRYAGYGMRNRLIDLLTITTAS